MDKELLEITNEFINEIIKTKYAFGDEQSFDDIVTRFNTALRKDNFPQCDSFISYFSQRKIIPAGSVLASYGTTNKSSFSNCYVIPIKQDSIEAIFDALKEASRTFSWRGGVGFDITILRPKDTPVDNSAKYSTGAVSFMPLISNVVNTIGQKNRRGASIITMDVHHPDVIDFIKCKSNPEEVFQKDVFNDYLPAVHYANISVKLTDDFMKAVENDENWDLVFPDIDFNKDFYNKQWDGNYEHWKQLGGKLKVYKTIKAKALFHLIAENAHKRAEPGILFWDTALKNSPQNALPETAVYTVNPCVTGDTLIAVADGRGEVSIKQLEEEGKDVPVFAVNDEGEITVKMMRHPRITGYNKDIYEVELDDGSKIKVTGNHEFRMKDGSYKEAKDLKFGDSLAIYARVKSNFEETIFNKPNNEDKQYFSWSNGEHLVFEHHLVFDFYHPGKQQVGYHIHHKDFNSINNSPDNLVLLPTEEHIKLHMLGDMNPARRFPEKNIFNNPEFQKMVREKYHIGATRKPETKERIGVTTKKRMQNPEFKEKWLARIREANGSEKVRRKMSESRLKMVLEEAKQKTDLPVFIYNNRVCVRKKCEVCGKEFIVPFGSRERAYCSKSCGNKGEAWKEAMQIRKVQFEEVKKDRKKFFIQEFIKYVNEHKIVPSLTEFKALLKELTNMSHIKSYGSYGFNSYVNFLKEMGKQFNVNINDRRKEEERRKLAEELISNGMIYNHKVVSVKYIGKDTVYNGTVDDVHNYMIKINETENGGKHYLNTKNCGEQQLSSYGACSLFHLVLYKFVKKAYTNEAYFDYKDFKTALSALASFADYIIDKNQHPLKAQKDFENLSRKIGIGVTGLADVLAMLNIDYDSDEALAFVDKLFSIFAKDLLEIEIDMAEEKGVCPILQKKSNLKQYLSFPAIQSHVDLLSNEYKEKLYKYGVRNIAWSTIAPTGSVSIVADNCTSGIEPVFELKYYRNITLLNKTVELLHAPLLNHIVKNAPEDLELPVEELKKRYHYKSAEEIDFNKRIQLQGIIQKYITDSISSTINLPEDVTVETVEKLYMEAYKQGLKGVTVYRTGCMTGILNKKESKIENNNQPAKLQIPEERDSKTFTMLWKSSKMYITVPTLNEKPIEVFVNLPPEAYYDSAGQRSIPIKLEREAMWSALTRIVSLALRYNIPVEAIIKQLDKASNTIGDLPNIISRALRKVSTIVFQDNKEICPSCGNHSLIREGGCYVCKSCGYSKCD